MNKVNILIQSNQIFEDHIDDLEERIECFLNFFENGFELLYDSGSIKLLNDILYVERENMSLLIENKKLNTSKFKTLYGEFELSVKGQDISWSKEPFSLSVKYLLKFGSTEEYINEIKIMLV